MLPAEASPSKEPGLFSWAWPGNDPTTLTAMAVLNSATMDGLMTTVRGVLPDPTLQVRELYGSTIAPTEEMYPKSSDVVRIHSDITANGWLANTKAIGGRRILFVIVRHPESGDDTPIPEGSQGHLGQHTLQYTLPATPEPVPDDIGELSDISESERRPKIKSWPRSEKGFNKWTVLIDKRIIRQQRLKSAYVSRGRRMFPNWIPEAGDPATVSYLADGDPYPRIQGVEPFPTPFGKSPIFHYR